MTPHRIRTRLAVIGVALAAVLVACTTPLLTSSAPRLDSIVPAAGAPGTQVEVTGLFGDATVVQVCGMPLEGWTVSNSVDAVLAAPGVAGSGRSYAAATGRIPEVPQGTRCDVTLAGTTLAEPLEFVTDGIVAADDGPIAIVEGGRLELPIEDLLANDASTLEPWGFARIVNASGVTVDVVGRTLEIVPTVAAAEAASFVYEIEDDQGLTDTATATLEVGFAPTTALVFDDPAEFTDFLASDYEIATFEDVFNTWPRAEGYDYYPNGLPLGYSGDADDWVYATDDIDGDGTGDPRIVMLENASDNQLLLSPEEEMFDFYTFEATLFSADEDNDAIGLVIAFHHDPDVRFDDDRNSGDLGQNRFLVAHRTRGGDPPYSGWGITLQQGDDSDDGNTVLADVDVDSEPTRFGGDWGAKDVTAGDAYTLDDGVTSRVRIERRGDVIRAWSGDWNEPEVDPDSLIELDLAARTINGRPLPTNVDWEIFRGPSQYGYFNDSQGGSTYLDVVFEGGAALDTAILLTGGSDTDGDGRDDIWTGSEVHRFDEVAGWQRVGGTTIQGELGAPRTVTSVAEPQAGSAFSGGYEVNDRSFRVRDGEVVALDD